jgi:hypothetical protein
MVGQEAGIECSVGSNADSFAKALAETNIGMIKTTLILRQL